MNDAPTGQTCGRLTAAGRPCRRRTPDGGPCHTHNVSPRAEGAPPPDVDPDGRGGRFWRAVVEDFELRPDESEMLAEAARLLDLVDALREAAAGGPLVAKGKVSPALVELRQVRQQLRRTLQALALPEPAGAQVSDEVATARSEKARRAAHARWNRDGAS